MRTPAETTRTVEARACRGDAEAFGQLIRTWDHDLRGVVWAIVRSSRDTDDVMQVAYERAFRSLANFRGESNLKTWLHSICYRSALDHQRYEGRRTHQSTDLLADRAAANSTSTEALARQELSAVLDQCDDETRALLMLTAGLGYSFDEVAEIVDLPRGTVASRVARARSRLRAAATLTEAHE